MERAAAEAMKEGKGKHKVTPSFKLTFEIETSTDLKRVLECGILNSKVKLTLRRSIRDREGVPRSDHQRDLKKKTGD